MLELALESRPESLPNEIEVDGAIVTKDAKKKKIQRGREH